MKIQSVGLLSAALALAGLLAGCASEPAREPGGKETVACCPHHEKRHARRGEIPPGVAVGVGQNKKPRPVGEGLARRETRRSFGASSPTMQEGPGGPNKLGNGPLYDANDNLNWEEAPPVGR